MLKRGFFRVVHRTVIFLPEAEADIETAFDWYETRETGLGGDFVLAIRCAQLAISEQPEIYPLQAEGFRRYLLHRFPYAIYFRPNDHSIAVVAVFHGSRHPDRLRDRLNKL